MSSYIPSHLTLVGERFGRYVERNIPFEEIKSLRDSLTWESYSTDTVGTRLHKRIVDSFFSLPTDEVYLQLHTIIHTNNVDIASKAYNRLQSKLRTLESDIPQFPVTQDKPIDACPIPAMTEATTNPDFATQKQVIVGGKRYRVSAIQLSEILITWEDDEFQRIITSAQYQLYSNNDTFLLGGIKTSKAEVVDVKIPDKEYVSKKSALGISKFCGGRFDDMSQALSDLNIILRSQNEPDCFASLKRLLTNCYDFRLQFKSQPVEARNAFYILDNKGNVLIIRCSDFVNSPERLKTMSAFSFPNLPRF
ncbi:hypothetical protein D5018_11610 [Parashewanella curva]|uniref:Uncharacterized protein n=1 Tax=Parashewanella curva TaxID=2338552 RepID=A0A3L8PXI6_9GAMM|nr:hypothetical protein [Parashewanella curva]RLV59509.1 hypothetical protein D5018_11610 [Parashewanella curva]